MASVWLMSNFPTLRRANFRPGQMSNLEYLELSHILAQFPLLLFGMRRFATRSARSACSPSCRSRRMLGISPPGPPDHFSIFIPLLSVLSTVRSYMRGIKSTTNIPHHQNTYEKARCRVVFVRA
jgi:hypothetical protein